MVAVSLWDIFGRKPKGIYSHCQQCRLSSGPWPSQAEADFHNERHERFQHGVLPGTPVGQCVGRVSRASSTSDGIALRSSSGLTASAPSSRVRNLLNF